MFAFGHLVILTAALWQCGRTEHDCEPVQATSSALLQSAPEFLAIVRTQQEGVKSRINAKSVWAGPGAKSVTWQSSFLEALQESCHGSLQWSLQGCITVHHL